MSFYQNESYKGHEYYKVSRSKSSDSKSRSNDSRSRSNASYSYSRPYSESYSR